MAKQEGKKILVEKKEENERIKKEQEEQMKIKEAEELARK